MKRASQAAIDLLTRPGNEGPCELRAYKCPAGVWTIGYGHTRGVKDGDHLADESAARFLLLEDLSDAERAVTQAVSAAVTQAQFDSLVCFVFNVGASAFRSSTLLRKLNAADYTGAAMEFERWTKAAGKELPGLVRRRKEERELFEVQQ